MVIIKGAENLMAYQKLDCFIVAGKPAKIGGVKGAAGSRSLSDELAQVKTNKKEFLSQIDRIVPWDEWVAIIKSHYYKGERGNKPYDLELMLRIYILQNLYNLADEATTCKIIDSRAFSDFCGVESSNQIPDGDTMGHRQISEYSGA
jgi:IS5 family transposase